MPPQSADLARISTPELPSTTNYGLPDEYRGDAHTVEGHARRLPSGRFVPLRPIYSIGVIPNRDRKWGKDNSRKK